MKQYLLFIIILLLPLSASYAQSANKNFVLSREYRQTGDHPNDVSKVNIQVQYFDGLGRPIQNVSVGQSPTGKDIVQPIVYDAYGRTALQHMPYTAASGNGNFQSDAVSSQKAFYAANVPGLESSDLGRPYTETGFDNSPLNRPVTSRAPGNKSAAASTSYGSNILGEVKQYDYAANADILQTVSRNGDYDAGRLHRTQTTDENDKVRIDYSDIYGNIICKKVVASENEILITYYIYDDLQRLRAVLQPMFQDDASTASFAFLYTYDTRGRIIAKKTPGAGIENMAYDNFDRPVLSQDPNQLARGVWAFTKYDIMNRPVMTGEVSSSQTRGQWQTALDASSAHHENKITSGIGYTLDNTIPAITEAELLNITYFDDYTFPKPANWEYSNIVFITILTNVYPQVTGTRTRILSQNGGQLLLSVNYYDAEYRHVETQREFYGNFSFEIVTKGYKYDLSLILDFDYTDSFSNNARNVYETDYKHDHAGRLISADELMSTEVGDENQNQFLAQQYNELGTLSKKYQHYAEYENKYRRGTDFTYNIRGWLTEANTKYKKVEGGPDLPFYGYKLNYENGSGFTNGNISSTLWKSKDEESYTKGLSYSFDGANRLTGSTGIGGYADTENGITYDKNGNIKTLIRSGSAVDNLIYSYTGNQLSTIHDASGNNSGIKSGSNSYTYDGNGNMTFDGSRGATIGYNSLNLPTTVTIAGKELNYIYDASGTKQQYITDTLTIKYLGQAEYDGNNHLKRISFQDGQFVHRDTAQFEFSVKDHLGNSRIVFDEQGKVLQSTDYYPFGLEIDRNNPATSQSDRNWVNRYLYNGKELQVESGYVDYGTRMYMPEIGRWGTRDRKADLLEMSSSYVYSLNSPLNYVDKDGQLPIFINGRVAFNSERRSSSYWDARLLATIKNSGIANPGGESHFTDGDQYATYSMGRNFIDHGDIASGINTPSRRHVAGYEIAKREFSAILGKLARDPESGKITEKIQIYTHSRGAAFGTGYVEALLKLINQNSNQFADSKNVIDFVLNLAPHQSDYSNAPNGTNSFSIDHTWDMLSGNDMGNNKSFTTNTSAGSFGKSHTNGTFNREVGTFIKAYQNSNGDNKTLANDFTKRMKSYGIKVTTN